MKIFRKWDQKLIDDDGCVMSKEAMSFYRAFKNYLKRNLPTDAELIGFKPNHYDTSGFVKLGDRYVYVSHNLRAGARTQADFTRKDAFGGVLIRTAKSSKDYCGGRNQFTSINNLVDDILALFENDREWEVA